MIGKKRYKNWLFCYVLLASLPAFANSIRVQGRLTDKEGNPRKNSQAKIRFEIFPIHDGGASLWIKDYENVVTNEAGLFALDIGPFQKEFFKSDSEYFLQIAVNDFGWQILKPRQKLSSVPFAIGSEYSDVSKTTQSVGPLAVSSISIQENAIDFFHIKPNSIHEIHIASQSISSDSLKNGSVTAEKLDHWAVHGDNIHPAEIRTEHIADNTIQAVDIDWGAIQVGHIQDGAITKEKLAFSLDSPPVIRAIKPEQFRNENLACPRRHSFDKVLSFDREVTGKVIPMIESVFVGYGYLESYGISAGTLNEKPVYTFIYNVVINQCETPGKGRFRLDVLFVEFPGL